MASGLDSRSRAAALPTGAERAGMAAAAGTVAAATLRCDPVRPETPGKTVSLLIGKDGVKDVPTGMRLLARACAADHEPACELIR